MLKLMVHGVLLTFTLIGTAFGQSGDGLKVFISKTTIISGRP